MKIRNAFFALLFVSAVSLPVFVCEDPEWEAMKAQLAQIEKAEKGPVLDRTPIQSPRVVARFGATEQAKIKVKPHEGVDLVSRAGEDLVYAVAPGFVFTDKNWLGEGRVTVFHYNVEGVSKTVYDDLAEVWVKNGQEVKAGESLGLMGQRPTAFRRHVHFEAHDESGRAIDPCAKEIMDCRRHADRYAAR